MAFIWDGAIALYAAIGSLTKLIFVLSHCPEEVNVLLSQEVNMLLSQQVHKLGKELRASHRHLALVIEDVAVTNRPSPCLACTSHSLSVPGALPNFAVPIHLNNLLPLTLGAVLSNPCKLMPCHPTLPPSLSFLYLLSASRR